MSMNDQANENQHNFFHDFSNGASSIVHQEEDASSRHDAETMPLLEFSLTRDQVVEMYQASGIKMKRRTVSRYALEGLLRAEKVDAERGLKRYMFNKQSVLDDIERRK